MTASVTTPIGGAWLIEDVTPADVFTRECLNDEQRMIAQTAEEFIDKEVLPVLDQLEQKDWELVRQRRPRPPGRHAGQGAATARPAGADAAPADPPAREGPRREPARRRGQGAQDRVQHAQLRPAEARRDVQRRRAARDRGGGAVRRA